MNALRPPSFPLTQPSPARGEGKKKHVFSKAAPAPSPSRIGMYWQMPDSLSMLPGHMQVEFQACESCGAARFRRKGTVCLDRFIQSVQSM